MAMPLEQIQGKYEIVAKLREGGMGAIYKVRHRLLDEIRVIKVLRPQHEGDHELNERFAREARSAIRLRHPNIVQIFDFSVDDAGNGFIVMEFIRGTDLQRLIARRQPPSLPLALEIARQGLRALGYLHQKGFVHRDISPDNLMLTLDVDGRPLVKMIDLGIAKHHESDAQLTASGMFLGKFRYSSPEHFGATAEAVIEARSDLYAFGLVLYELVTGEFPIHGDNSSQLIAGHLFRPPRDFADTDPEGRVPDNLRAVLLRTLAKQVAERPASARELTAALDQIQRQHPLTPAAQDETRSLILSAAEDEAIERATSSTQHRLDAGFGFDPTPPPTTADILPATELSTPATETASSSSTATAIPPVAAGATREQQMAALLIGAETLRSLGQSEPARQQLEALLRLAPDHARARELLTDLVGEGESTTANELLEATPSTTDTVFDRHLEAAFAATEEADYERAVREFESAFAAQPRNPAVRQLLAEARSNQRRQEQQQALQTLTEDVESLIASGDVAAGRERLAAARDSYGDWPAFRDNVEPALSTRLADGEAGVARERQQAEITAVVDEVENLIARGLRIDADRILFQALERHGADERLAEMRQRLAAIHHQELAAQVTALADEADELAASERYLEALERLAKAQVIAPAASQLHTDLVDHQERLRREMAEDTQRQAMIEAAASSIEELLQQQRLEDAEGELARLVADLGHHRSFRRRLDEMRQDVESARLDRLQAVVREAGIAFESGRFGDAVDLLARAKDLAPENTWISGRLAAARVELERELAEERQREVQAAKIRDFLQQAKKARDTHDLLKARLLIAQVLELAPEHAEARRLAKALDRQEP